MTDQPRMIKRRPFEVQHAVALLGLLSLTAGVVYLAATLSSPLRSRAPDVPAAPWIQPVTRPLSIVTSGPREGARAPAFSASSFSGGTLSLEDLQGKGVVMNFFASWCAPCRAEAGELEATYRKYRDQ